MKARHLITAIFAHVFGAGSSDLPPRDQSLPSRSRSRSRGRPSRKSRLFLKDYPETHPTKKLARAYKRTFGGVCGAMSWTDLARNLKAGKLNNQAN